MSTVLCAILQTLISIKYTVIFVTSGAFFTKFYVMHSITHIRSVYLAFFSTRHCSTSALDIPPSSRRTDALFTSTMQAGFYTAYTSATELHINTGYTAVALDEAQAASRPLVASRNATKVTA
ncbi:hypothetical protein GN958_ATG22232 [Phytophthora infestans]|uniref:Uncharacterized protein n=1 Tax=Phytophthora infestans TaxID=4787 RepID=A0A8S9TJJ9_PHYIN|nr:hypothetical protein GN958_ATG22232 [Phytophthora infestans]